MNTRTRMKIRAMKQRQNPQAMAVVRGDDGIARAIFVDLDKQEEARLWFGDRLIELMKEDT